MGVGDAVGNGCFVKIETGKVAGIGGVAQTEVDTAGAVVHGGFQRRQAAGRADQFHGWQCGALSEGFRILHK